MQYNYINNILGFALAAACGQLVKLTERFFIIITPRAHARARGYVIGRGVYIIIVVYLHFFWNQYFISKNTHFERSILTQIGFSSNLMASDTA